MNRVKQTIPLKLTTKTTNGTALFCRLLNEDKYAEFMTTQGVPPRLPNHRNTIEKNSTLSVITIFDSGALRVWRSDLKATVFEILLMDLLIKGSIDILADNGSSTVSPVGSPVGTFVDSSFPKDASIPSNPITAVAGEIDSTLAFGFASGDIVCLDFTQPISPACRWRIPESQCHIESVSSLVWHNGFLLSCSLDSSACVWDCRSTCGSPPFTIPCLFVLSAASLNPISVCWVFGSDVWILGTWTSKIYTVDISLLRSPKIESPSPLHRMTEVGFDPLGSACMNSALTAITGSLNCQRQVFIGTSDGVVTSVALIAQVAEEDAVEEGKGLILKRGRTWQVTEHGISALVSATPALLNFKEVLLVADEGGCVTVCVPSLAVSVFSLRCHSVSGISLVGNYEEGIVTCGKDRRLQLLDDQVIFGLCNERLRMDREDYRSQMLNIPWRAEKPKKAKKKGKKGKAKTKGKGKSKK